RMRVVEAHGEGRATLERRVHLEQENLMIRLDQQQQKPGEEPDVWQWAKLTHVDPQPFEVRFDLADLDVHGGSARLAIAFRGLSELVRPRKAAGDPLEDHAVELTLNGQPLPTQRWDGRDEVRREIELPAARLKARDNRLVLRVPKRALPWAPAQVAVDVVMFNSIEARYPAGGDVDTAAALTVRSGEGSALELRASGDEAPALYGDDGVLRLPRALGARRFAYAPAATGVELTPATPHGFSEPVFLRAVTGADWRAPAQGYDYLIVAHPRLLDAIEPLAQFHRQRGLSVAVLDIDSVYDQYNHGITHPQAIRNLVDAAWNRWPSKPRFLLLVGDSSFDIRHETYNDLAYAKWTDRELLFPGHFGAVPGGTYANAPKRLADRNLIPTWQYPSPEGQSASDNWFGAVDGDDWHPVVAVGRFPVVEPDEVTAIVDKTIDYLSKPQLGAWRRDVMFIADEVDTFQRASDEIAGALGKDGFLADKVYAKPEVTENVVHQRAIHDGIDEGRLLVHFIGHGGRYIWRTGPPDLRKNHDLFTLEDVSNLSNGGRLPMVLSMTCYSAPFDNPTEDSIGERFLREKDKGAIAVFAASWRNSPSPAFSKDVIAELLAPGATIGEAIVRAKKRSKDRVLVEMYNLLGDPAVVLERPHDELVAAFDGDRWNPGVMVDLKQAGFDGEVAVDWLAADGGKIASSTYSARSPRFRLPVPDGAAGKATQVRIYAASPTSGRDAVGATALVAAPSPSLGARIAAAWKQWLHPAHPSQRHDDTIAILDFDGAAR
ncbi:MAG TPA: C25 family cysteine peptidase, partial [Dokdonella sp.]|nr:C25 family cysteine peptidase [Dokdonella sp.]